MSRTADLEISGRRPRRIILAASAGNFAEWYDWGVYGVVATIVAKTFFPDSSDVAALLNTYLDLRRGLHRPPARRGAFRPDRRQARAPPRAVADDRRHVPGHHAHGHGPDLRLDRPARAGAAARRAARPVGRRRRRVRQRDQLRLRAQPAAP